MTITTTQTKIGRPEKRPIDIATDNLRVATLERLILASIRKRESRKRGELLTTGGVIRLLCANYLDGEGLPLDLVIDVNELQPDISQDLDKTGVYSVSTAA